MQTANICGLRAVPVSFSMRSEGGRPVLFVVCMCACRIRSVLVMAPCSVPAQSQPFIRSNGFAGFKHQIGLGSL